MNLTDNLQREDHREEPPKKRLLENWPEPNQGRSRERGLLAGDLH